LQKYPDPKADVVNAVYDYFCWAKGNWGLADFLAQCTEDEIPEWMRETCIRIRELLQLPPEEATAEEQQESDETITGPGANQPQSPDDSIQNGV
jgi:putative ATP-dependent endonuclease of OLD family